MFHLTIYLDYHLPEKAIRLMDEACSSVTEGKFRVCYFFYMAV